MKTVSTLGFAVSLMFSAIALANPTATSETTPPATPPAAGPQVVEQSTAHPVFGQNLFKGFQQAEFKGFNPDYKLAIGDKITLQMWGAYEIAVELTVDAQGNVFIPQVGPVKLQGVANKDLNKVVERRVRDIYQNNVNLYASLNTTEPVKLFVTGFVQSPGLYGGFSSDSILAFLAKSGGIRSESGSYLNVELKRNGKVRARFNLYDFLLTGKIEQVQLQDGDTLVVNSRQSVANFTGLVENPVQIEFSGNTIPLQKALDLVGVMPNATHVRIARNQMLKRNVDYIPIAQAQGVMLENGDEISAVSDKMPGTISVSVEGEHNGQAVYILPYGSTINDLMAKLSPNERSNLEAMQLYREEVSARQKEMLEVQLQQLERTALSARSKSVGEAQLRKSDAEAILQFVAKARQVQPRGQVLLGQNDNRMDVMLKDQDKIIIPNKTVLVQVHGEVMFPNAMVYDQKNSIEDYIKASGGYSQKADQSRVLVLHRDGTIAQVAYNDSMFNSGLEDFTVKPGDEILVMPQIDNKSMQYASDIMQIIYQVAMSSAVVLGL